MKLSGLELMASIRMSQANDALDIDLDILSAQTPVNQMFFSTLFFDMLNGDVTGADGGSASTGFKVKVYNTDDTMYTETTVDKLDWYETESGYVSEAMTTVVEAVGADKYVRKLDVYYVANDGDVDKEVLVLSSEIIGNSNFAMDDGNGIKGIKLATADGSATITATVKFLIAV